MVSEIKLLKRLNHILRYQIKYVILFSIFILTSALLITKYYPFKSKYNIEDKTIEGIILSMYTDGDKLNLLVSAKEKIIVNYYFESEKEKREYENTLNLGDTLEMSGTLKVPPSNTVPNTFNYKNYLYNHKVYYLLDADKLIKIKNNTSVINYLKNKIRNKIKNYNEKVQGYLYTFIIGDKKYLDNEVKKEYQNNGVSHLFSISGMHVSLFTGCLFMVLKRLAYNVRLRYYLVIIFLIFYMLIIDYSPSVLRTFLMFSLFGFNKIYRLNYKKINILLLIFDIMIILDPFNLYNMAFWLSYLISSSLVLFSKRIEKYHNYFVKLLVVSSISFLISFPIVIYNSYQINILSIFYNLVLVPYVSIILFPLALLTFVFPILQGILSFLIQILESISSYFSSLNTTIILAKIPFYVIFIYYIIIILVLYNKKYIIFFLLTIILHKNISSFDSSLLISFIDVGQGDSELIKMPYNKGNILIDTGGRITYSKEKWQERKSNYSISLSTIIPYLKSLGINKLSYLVLTHGDYDHMGEAISLINNFKVENVIFNCGSYNALEKNLIRELEKKHIKYFSCIKSLNIDNNNFYFLQTKEYDNENDNSNVIYIKIYDYKFLFMGDAGIEKEKDILQKYNLSNIDVLKVGHHGSKTSSSKEFINVITPKYSIISVGKNNRYGHPNREVLNNLANTKIYRTDEDGSIMFKIKSNKLKKETCSP